MLAELLMATQVIASTGDHYHVPQAERSVLEAVAMSVRCG